MTTTAHVSDEVCAYTACPASLCTATHLLLIMLERETGFPLGTLPLTLQQRILRVEEKSCSRCAVPHSDWKLSELLIGNKLIIHW